MSPRLAILVCAWSLAGCAGLQPDPSNTAAYCTADNAFRLGSQARAYFGVCPKESESAFLAGLQRGRALVPPTPQAQPFLAQMTEVEKQLIAAGSEAERQRLRARLADLEWWAIHIINSPGSYAVDS
ncbi:MAG: DUF2799 domain-containing protein [Burkholderiales bacterium]